ncbi:hypothetical protein O9992_18200 [Vibrio lentus]|nr:hypothetical protein [Vibrio lentus]
MFGIPSSIDAAATEDFVQDPQDLYDAFELLTTQRCQPLCAV